VEVQKDRNNLTGRAITLGNFDGVHLGHQALLQKTTSLANSDQLNSLALTYHPNPAIVLGKKTDFTYLQSLESRIQNILSYGIQEVEVLPFTRELSEMEAEDFLANILLKKFHAKHIIIGYNHCFGKNRRGNFELLQSLSNQFDYKVTQVEPVFAGEWKISSSLIREFLKNGDLANTKICLGRNYSLEGTVVEGRKEGRKLGYPTANLSIPQDLVKPGKAVYATLANGRPSMTNVGTKPTFGDDTLTIETHIFDTNEDLYGTKIKLDFIQKVREVEKFPSLEALIQQLSRDEVTSRKIFSK
jgi:riboflavin kinase / FMN adenylyltransferase